MPLKFGSADLVLPGVDRVYAGPQLVWPAAGPVFPANVIHAWNPDGGGNASGYVPDAVGTAPLYVVAGGATNSLVPDWTGALAASQALILEPADSPAFKAAPFATLSYWMKRSGKGNNYSPVVHWTRGFPPLGEGVSGMFIVRLTTSAGPQFFVKRDAGQATGQLDDDISEGDAWVHFVIVLGDSRWLLRRNDADDVNASWADTAKATTEDQILQFGGWRSEGDVATTTWGGANVENGLIGRFKDIRIYNTALSESEITALHAAGPQTY
ncbi:LamG domain-containing protein [Hyphomonas pacifica]|uniref:LamG-like jellyroll fold domain-containing protein n=1 Tax=Hyphomonas pacifica TaxID=1280941 RepID=A0A8B2PH06_9PROT|nr:LamG-like jellyroll fold domain-containing protein [Hyphomonas pacifica]RAN30620.1 hypothetical protein HY3_05580 [Hyphomonas pacifica]